MALEFDQDFVNALPETYALLRTTKLEFILLSRGSSCMVHAAFQIITEQIQILI